MKNHLLLFLFCFLSWCPATGQKFQPYTWDDYVSALTRDEEQGEDEDWNEWLEELAQLHAHPQNLNTAPAEDLGKIPVLTPEVVEQIQAYIYLHGPLRTLAELRLVPGVPEDVWRVLPLFVYVDSQQVSPPRSRPQRERLHGGADYRVDVPCYYRKGYCVHPGYAGDPLYHRFRAQAACGSYRLGWRMEKDAGERYYDSYGGYVDVAGKGVLHRVVLGDFRAGFGQGLVLGSGSSWGLADLFSTTTQGIRPMKGMDEYRFLRGVSAELRFPTPRAGLFSLTPFASWRRMDASLDADGHIHTLQRSGYHRTISERASRHSVSHLFVGAHLGWRLRALSLGTTATWLRSSVPFSPGTAVYRQIYPSGSRFGNVAVDYAYSLYRLHVSGEAAYSTSCGGWATVHRLSWTASPRFRLALLPRFYSYRYHAFHASAPTSTGSTPQNESGLTVNVRTLPFSGVVLALSADASHHPWPRYGVSQASDRYRVQLDGEYALNRRHLFLARYQWRRGLEQGDVRRIHHQLRAEWQWLAHARHRLHAVVWGHRASRRTGWAVSARWQGEAARSGWAGALVCSWFRIPGSPQRLWTYEPALLGSVYGTTLYGRGLRAVGKIRWKSAAGRWLIEGKWGSTYRMDTAVQGSGLQTILGRWKTDFAVLTGFNF